jgi:two-component system, cell cycle sensor histidine kinase and response regulator CckA
MDDSFLPPTRLPFGSRPRAIRLLLLLLFLFTCCLWFSSRALLSSNFLPHWYCLAGNTRLLWTTVLGDLFIGLSYVVISATLVRILRRAGKALPYQGFFWAFGLFIVSCGVTHFLEILTIWQPVYWLAASAKILTAVSSVGTAIVLLIAAEDIVSFARAARQVATGRGHERFRALFMATPLAVISFDLEGLVTGWNPGAEKIFGIAETDAIGKHNPTIPAELLSEHRRLLKNTLDGSVTMGHETIRQRSNGDRISVNISTAPLYGGDGEQIGVMAAIEDISERKRMELELKEKSAILLTVTQSLNIYLETGEWKLASRELLAFALEQTASDYGFLGVVLDDSRLRMLAHDGTSWDLQIARDRVGDVVGEVADDLKKPALNNGNGNFQNLHGLFSEVILSGRTVIANDSSYGPRTASPPDVQLSNGQESDGHVPFEAFLGVPIYKGNEVAGLIGVANRSDGYSGTEWRALDTMSRATGILYDNYRQTLKRAALEEKQAVLESYLRQSQNLDLLGRVAGGFAHDFNNLLMILSGASELLDRSLGPESLSRVYVDQIQRGTTKAAAITRQLLAFSRKQVMDIRPMDLHPALFDSRSMLSHLLGFGIELRLVLEASNSWIRSDLPQIVQVIVNLTSNARDAMPAGGQLVISTRNTETAPPAASPAAKVSDWVVLEVRDTGSGMDPQTLAQIFEPFFTTKPVGSGTGLGLCAVYGVVRQSGGYVQVHSDPGKGTCFEIYFPTIAAPQTFSPTLEPAKVDSLPESATVLLVDDESALVHAIGQFLRDSGYLVLDAFSSQDALDLAKEHPGRIDVLVTDVIMPGLRGPDLHQQIVELQPEIRVLFMSGYAEGLPEMKLPDGALFLQKPFRFSTLLETLRQLQRRK